MRCSLPLSASVPGPAKKPVSLEGIEIINWTALPPQAGKGVCDSTPTDGAASSGDVSRSLFASIRF